MAVTSKLANHSIAIECTASAGHTYWNKWDGAYGVRAQAWDRVRQLRAEHPERRFVVHTRLVAQR